MRYTPTPDQKRVLDYLDGFLREYGYSPSCREVAAATGKSLGAAYQSLRGLEDRGHIRMLRGHRRSITLTEESAA